MNFDTNLFLPDSFFILFFFKTVIVVKVLNGLNDLEKKNYEVKVRKKNVKKGDSAGFELRSPA